MRRLRKKRGESLEQFAGELGVHKSTVSRWENGISPISKLARKAIDDLRQSAKTKKNGAAS